jgi:hypothetical protein
MWAIDAHGTSVTWSSRFEPDDPNEADSLAAHYHALYGARLTRLKEIPEAPRR